MDTRQPLAIQVKSFNPVAMYAALATSVLAIILSVAVPLFFPWDGSFEQQSNAASASILALLAVVAIGVLGLIFAIVAVGQAGKRRSEGVGFAAGGTALLAVLVMIGSVLQLFYYVFIFAFIGG